MRRSIGVALLTLGFFLLCVAPVVRFYAADALIIAPVDVKTSTTLHARGATYLSGEGKTVSGASLDLTSTNTGLPFASGSDTAIWDSVSTLKDATTGTEIQRTEWRMAFDRGTGLLKACCTAAVNGDTTVEQSGLGPLFPLDRVEKKDYERFDPATRRAWPITFAGEEEVEGIAAYRFVQEIPPTPLGERMEIPGSLVGMPKEKAVGVTRFYWAKTTMWVDPRSGTTLDVRQQLTAKLRTDDGIDRATALEADLVLDDENRRELAGTAESAAQRIAMIRVALPLGSLVLGGVLLISGMFVLRNRGRHRDTAPQVT